MEQKEVVMGLSQRISQGDSSP